MNVLLMTIDEIREIAVKLAKKAKAEIPNVTKEYWGFETFYVTETLVREGELFTMELKCASDEDYKLSHQDLVNYKIIVSCVVTMPLQTPYFHSIPLMYGSLEEVVDTIDSKEKITLSIMHFDKLLREVVEEI